jgi:hypothetical protein
MTQADSVHSTPQARANLSHSVVSSDNGLTDEITPDADANLHPLPSDPVALH